MGLAQEPLTFKVAPHIVEDLGLNLYTSLPRVLVEFIANAYDADARSVSIDVDVQAIAKARNAMKEAFNLESKRARDSSVALMPLGERALPKSHTIVITDSGFGMSRNDLNTKFLVAGRRRRKAEPEEKGRSPGGRPLMGRKGLGKLAGFGVAKVVEIVTRKRGEPHATKITLAYDQIHKVTRAEDIKIPEELLLDGAGLPEAGGTKITLSELLYDPTKAGSESIEHEIADHFEMIDEVDFSILLNGRPVQRKVRPLAFAYPEPSRAIDEFVTKVMTREDGRPFSFEYRMRFTGEEHALTAARRGVRVYAHRRLAAAPSLLAADTNMHGFRMTDYLDGVVHADFLDEEDADYIATDRQSLRWDSPLLADVYLFLSEEIREACKAAQKRRDESSKDAVREDAFTKTSIQQHGLSKRDEHFAFRMAAILRSACKRGVQDPVYKAKLPVLVKSIGAGNVISAITQLASEDHPTLDKVALQIARLRMVEIDQLVTSAHARVKAVDALRKIVEDVNFSTSNEEKKVHALLGRAPWLIDTRFGHYVSSNQSMDTLVKRLTSMLKVGVSAPTKIDPEERPDLVFLLGGEAFGHIVVIELKAPNEMLDTDDLDQLLDYMEQVRNWLDEHEKGNVQVTGQLIGSLADPRAGGRKIRALRQRMKEGKNQPWKIRDFAALLKDAQASHREIIDTLAPMVDDSEDDSGDDES